MRASILRILMAWIWLSAAGAKWGQTLDMAEVIAGYRILPPELVPLLAVVLPPLELILGLTLLVGFLVESSLLLSGLLFTIFAAAIGQGMWRGIDINCGCFSLESTANGFTWAHLVLNLVLAALAFWLLKTGERGMLAADNVLWREQETVAEVDEGG